MQLKDAYTSTKIRYCCITVILLLYLNRIKREAKNNNKTMSWFNRRIVEKKFSAIAGVEKKKKSWLELIRSMAATLTDYRTIWRIPGRERQLPNIFTGTKNFYKIVKSLSHGVKKGCGGAKKKLQNLTLQNRNMETTGQKSRNSSALKP